MVAKSIGKIGDRVLVDLLVLKQKRGPLKDYSLNMSISYRHGLGASILLPFLLAELSFLPKYEESAEYYQGNDTVEIL